MAYSNWGAFVYRNGERQEDCEDVPVFGDREAEASVLSGLRIFINLTKTQREGQDAWWAHAHHAVLGKGPVRLAGYKCTPELWVMLGEEYWRVPLDDVCSVDEDTTLESVIGTSVYGPESLWKYRIHHFDGNMIDLQLEEPDGTLWTARCGYEYGAGFD